MRLNSKKFFEEAKKNNFTAADLNYSKSRSVALSVFHGEVESYTETSSFAVEVRGILNGKFGSYTTNIVNKDTIGNMIKGIKDTATVIESDDPAIIFKGSKKYHKKNVYNPEVSKMDIKEVIKTLLLIEKKLKEYDKRISEVATVGFELEEDESALENSYGLKLKEKNAKYVYYAEIAAKDGEEVKTGFAVFVSGNPTEFNIDKFVEKVAQDGLKKLGGTQCASKKYPVVMNQETVSNMLSFMLVSIDAEKVQKNTSLLKGKLHEQIASKKLTVIENPLQKNVHFSYFDDEGVAKTKKTIIKKGVLETYIYTLETAAKDGVEPTGNASRAGLKSSAVVDCFVVKPGKHNFDEMIKDIKEGVFITGVTGLHAGMNANSGNFSLQSDGFMIRDGKIAEPLALITVAGNLFDMFMNIKDIANDSELQLSGHTTPSIYFKKLAVSGK